MKNQHTNQGSTLRVFRRNVYLVALLCAMIFTGQKAAAQANLYQFTPTTGSFHVKTRRVHASYMGGHCGWRGRGIVNCLECTETLKKTRQRLHDAVVIM